MVKRTNAIILSLNPDIPHSLLAFDPDFKMMDLPVMPRKLAEDFYRTAKRYLGRSM